MHQEAFVYVAMASNLLLQDVSFFSSRLLASELILSLYSSISSLIGCSGYISASHRRLNGCIFHVKIANQYYVSVVFAS